MLYADRHCTYTEEIRNGEHVYVFTGPCRVTKKPYTVVVPGDGLYKYRQGVLIQDAFPCMTPEDREFLMSGASPEGWDKLFGDE